MIILAFICLLMGSLSILGLCMMLHDIVRGHDGIEENRNKE